MTMVQDSNTRHFGGMAYDHMYPSHSQPATQFTDPWAPSLNSNNSYHTTLSRQAQQPQHRPNLSLQYSHIPTSAPLVSGSLYSSAAYAGSDLLSLTQDVSSNPYASEQAFSPSATSSSAYSAASYPSSLSYAQSMAQQQQEQSRKLSDPIEQSRAANATFGELDASRGMLALSHSNLTDLTPRNIFEARSQRGSTDSYGFPSHSTSSSMSGPSGGREYNYYGSSSIASADSATDYSSAASDAGYDNMAASRTLPRPNQLMGANLPPAPQSMMSQFSSKMSSNTQKKHKCKVCDKRFTRPSSLQTHMYSHTGEKPFRCSVEACGREFSVVSNLRRHQKVHKDHASISSQSDHE